MITANTNYSDSTPRYDFMGKSTDTKPIVSFNGKPIKNGSTFFEMDTKTVFFYDEDTDTWL